MKHLKLPGLVAVVALALVAFPADDAKATVSVLCTVQESTCPKGNRWATGTELDITLQSGTSAILSNTAGEVLDTCAGSTAKGKLEKLEAATGPVESLTWSNCLVPGTKTLTAGKIEVEKIAGNHNGTVISDGTCEVTFTWLSVPCIYGVAPWTSLGELKEGAPAAFVANAVVKRLSGSNFSCPETMKWTAEYTLTEPKEKALSVESG